MTYYRYNDYPSRTLCEVLEEMRKAYECRNFAGLLGLVEEVQTKANRMESAIEDVKKIKEIEGRRQDAKDELRKLELKIEQAEAKLGELPKEHKNDEEKKENAVRDSSSQD